MESPKIKWINMPYTVKTSNPNFQITSYSLACNVMLQLIMAGDSLRQKLAFPVAMGLVKSPTNSETSMLLRRVQKELLKKHIFVQNMSYDGASRGLAHKVCPCLPSDTCQCNASSYKPTFASYVVRDEIQNVQSKYAKCEPEKIASDIMESIDAFISHLRDCISRGRRKYSDPDSPYSGYFPDLTDDDCFDSLKRISKTIKSNQLDAREDRNLKDFLLIVKTAIYGGRLPIQKSHIATKNTKNLVDMMKSIIMDDDTKELKDLLFQNMVAVHSCIFAYLFSSKHKPLIHIM